MKRPAVAAEKHTHFVFLAIPSITPLLCCPEDFLLRLSSSASRVALMPGLSPSYQLWLKEELNPEPEGKAPSMSIVNWQGRKTQQRCSPAASLFACAGCARGRAFQQERLNSRGLSATSPRQATMSSEPSTEFASRFTTVLSYVVPEDGIFLR